MSISGREKRILEGIIQLLIQEWGFAAVVEVTEYLGRENRDTHGRERHGDKRQGKERSRNDVGWIGKKLLAEHVNQSDIEPARRMIIMNIISLYNNKKFLSSASAVREFLNMNGDYIEYAGGRTEGLRRILPHLLRLSPEQLQNLADTQIDGGPARLGPLADAIQSAGEEIRRSDQAGSTRNKETAAQIGERIESNFENTYEKNQESTEEKNKSARKSELK